MSPDDARLLERGRAVLDREAAALQTVSRDLDANFCAVVRRILAGRGRVVVCGVGKAGHIGRKLSASLASTGTRSFCLDALDAMHGDLGMVGPEDLVLLISNSGSSGELLLVAQALKDAGITTLAMTRDTETPLAQMCAEVLPLGRHEEAGPHNLAPTTSTTVMLALGDALAVTLETERGFTREDYAQFHPAGALGRRLKRVGQCMRTGDQAAYAEAGATVAEAIERITEARCGMCLIVDAAGRLEGVFTDGDLRRSLARKLDINHATVARAMTSPCKYVDAEALVEDAIEIMRSSRINALPVVDAEHRAVGILDIQDVA